MKNNKEQHDIDDCFKNHFGDAEAPKFNFEKNTSKIEEENAIDALFQSSFEEYEQAPNEKIWENVQKELPLHLLWRRRLTQLSKVAAIFLVGTFLSLLISEKSDTIRNMVYQNQTEVPQEAPAPIIEPADFVFDVNKNGDLDQQENSKTLFQDDTNNSNKISEEELAANKALLVPVSPLPQLPLQEISIPNQMEEYAAEQSMSNSLPITGTKLEGKEKEASKYETDILVRHNQVNPAQ